MKGVVTMGIIQLRKNLSERIDAAFFFKEPTVIKNEKKNEPRAALVPYEWLVDMCRQRGIPVPDSAATMDGEEATEA